MLLWLSIAWSSARGRAGSGVPPRRLEEVLENLLEATVRSEHVRQQCHTVPAHRLQELLLGQRMRLG